MGITGSYEGYVTSPLYLYNKGTWSNLQIPRCSMTYSLDNETKISLGERIYLECARNSSTGKCEGIGRFDSSIDLTNYTYLNFNVTNNAYINQNRSKAYQIYLGVSTSANLTSYSFSANYLYSGKVQDFPCGNKKVNISSLKGNFFIYLGLKLDSGTNGYTHGIQIEKVYLSNT